MKSLQADFFKVMKEGAIQYVPVAQLKIIKTSNPFCCIYY